MEQQTEIIAAKDIIQFYKNLRVSYGLSEKNIEFYVPIYESQTKELESIFGKFADGNKTVYLLGQSGSGKSTILDYLRFKSPVLKDKYYYVTVRFDDPDYGCDFDDPSFDIIEIYITIFTRVLYEASAILDEDYKKTLLAKLQLLENKKDIYDISEEEKKWSFTSWLIEFLTTVGVGTFGIKWQLDTATKTIIRKKFSTKATDFLQLLNDLLSKIDITAEKPLFLVLDGLEKIKDIATLRKIFTINGISSLKGLLCKKIIICPVHLPSFIDSAFFANEEILINLKIYNNPRTKSEGFEVIVNDNRMLMRRLAEKRVDLSQNSLVDFVEEKALQLAIDFSGGFLHDYFKILSDSIIKADVAGSDVVRKEHIEAVLSDLEFNRAGTFSFSSESSRLLYEILKNNTITDEKDETFVRQVLLNNIIIIKNNERWHKIHPLIEKTVKTFGEILEK